MDDVASTRPPRTGRQPRTGNPGNGSSAGRPATAVRLAALRSVADRIAIAESIADDTRSSARDRLAALGLLLRIAGLHDLAYDPVAAARAEAEADRLNALFDVLQSTNEET
jgi:hypothetical protein